VTKSQVVSAGRVIERSSARHADVAAALVGMKAAQVLDGAALVIVLVVGGSWGPGAVVAGAAEQVLRRGEYCLGCCCSKKECWKSLCKLCIRKTPKMNKYLPRWCDRSCVQYCIVEGSGSSAGEL
jgi:hypothetical protein